MWFLVVGTVSPQRRLHSPGTASAAEAAMPQRVTWFAPPRRQQTGLPPQRCVPLAGRRKIAIFRLMPWAGGLRSLRGPPSGTRD